MNLSTDQQKHLPDLVSLALIGFAFLKADPQASEWSHPALEAFRPLVDDTLQKRRAERLARIFE